ncbi:MULTISPECIES: hypothetical protein [Bacillales]|uniref:Uncharacterized protein n=2 Tax=Bacillaceae TaxID=186817 RepID=A0A0V8JQC4_9BACI|nr:MULTISPECIES: hypothetical protein [Bacillaceae]KSU89237.1 hypothetical protein AS180_03665 [Priestia veravalensis]NMO75632.1 hypothetical protein [Niallia alba]
MKANDKLIKEMEAFDDAFPNGVFAIPRNPNDPRIKVRALWDYCKKKWIDIEFISEEELKQFLTKSNNYKNT